MPDEMTKYAVDEDVDQDVLEKRANNGCPKCGRKVDMHGKTAVCANCGTEPFEDKK